MMSLAPVKPEAVRRPDFVASYQQHLVYLLRIQRRRFAVLWEYYQERQTSQTALLTAGGTAPAAQALSSHRLLQLVLLNRYTSTSSLS